MKLINKKLGKIVFFGEGIVDLQKIGCKNVAEMIEAGWEDYEEPIKPYWFINDLDGKPMKCDLKNCGKSNFIEWSEHRKEIGNYFETKEEAEKALEKLKAWKRLKDKGFRFTGFSGGRTIIEFTFDDYCSGEPSSAFDDLDLLFGGGE